MARATSNNVTIWTTSTVVLPEVAGRTFVIITNNSNEDIWLAFDEAAVLTKWVVVKASGGTVSLNSSQHFALLSLPINAISTTGSKVLSYTFA